MGSWPYILITLPYRFEVITFEIITIREILSTCFFPLQVCHGGNGTVSNRRSSFRAKTLSWRSRKDEMGVSLQHALGAKRESCRKVFRCASRFLRAVLGHVLFRALEAIREVRKHRMVAKGEGFIPAGASRELRV